MTSTAIIYETVRGVDLRLTTQAGVFAVRVVDDGRGFDVVPAARNAVLDGHLGLMGMQERLDQVGGTLSIRSRCGEGTMVECRVPVMTSV